MANPDIIPCPKGSWTKIATNVTYGQVFNKGTLARYFQTIRLTGDTAPTDLSDAIQIFKKSKNAIISSTLPIDVYLYCQRAAGNVRVDL